MDRYVDYAEAPKEGYWPFLGAVANGLEVIYLNFLGSLKKLNDFISIFMEWIENDIYRSGF